MGKQFQGLLKKQVPCIQRTTLALPDRSSEDQAGFPCAALGHPFLSAHRLQQGEEVYCF